MTKNKIIKELIRKWIEEQNTYNRISQSSDPNYVKINFYGHIIMMPRIKFLTLHTEVVIRHELTKLNKPELERLYFEVI